MSECYRKYFFINNLVKSSTEFDDNILAKGKSLYDVVLVKNSIPLFLQKYLMRICRTAKLEGVQLWLSNDEIKNKILDLIKINEIEEDSLKIVFSFGNDFFGQKENIFLAYMMVNNAPTVEQFKIGVETISYSAERQNPHAKVFNFNLRTKISELINQKNIYEVILVDNKGFITEGSRSNLFFIKDKIVYTTIIDSVLPGITRENIIEVCTKNKIEILETKVKYDDLIYFDSVFMTGTSRKVLPINKIDDLKFNTENLILRQIQNLYDIEIQRYINLHK